MLDKNGAITLQLTHEDNNMVDETRLISSVEGQDCVVYAPRVYIQELYDWFNDLSFNDQDEAPSWFGDMMDTVSDDWED